MWCWVRSAASGCRCRPPLLGRAWLTPPPPRPRPPPHTHRPTPRALAEVEISRERVPLSAAYKAVGQRCQLRINGGASHEVPVSSPPHDSGEWRWACGRARARGGASHEVPVSSPPHDSGARLRAPAGKAWRHGGGHAGQGPGCREVLVQGHLPVAGLFHPVRRLWVVQFEKGVAPEDFDYERRGARTGGDPSSHPALPRVPSAPQRSTTCLSWCHAATSLPAPPSKLLSPQA
jgi:hypothetical protein